VPEQESGESKNYAQPLNKDPARNLINANKKLGVKD